MGPETIQALISDCTVTNATATVHGKVYPAISPTRPELSQAGKVVLITGGGTGVGFSIAQSFIRASANTVVILGRRADVLEDAVSRFTEEAKSAGSNTMIKHYICDLLKREEIEAMWNDLAAQGILVDVLVNNAAKFSDPKPLLELGADEIWSQVETNAKGPLYLTEKFCLQKTDKQRFIVNISSAVIHSFHYPAVAARPAYTFSKATSTLYFQLLAQELAPDKIQMVTMHPGVIYSDAWKALGCPPEWFEDPSLCGSVAVWLASREAVFLHGRFIWASWDVTELASGDIRKRIEDDQYFLKVSVEGLRLGMVS